MYHADLYTRLVCPVSGPLASTPTLLGGLLGCPEGLADQFPRTSRRSHLADKGFVVTRDLRIESEEAVGFPVEGGHGVEVNGHTSRLVDGERNVNPGPRVRQERLRNMKVEVDPPEGTPRWVVEWDLRSTPSSLVLVRRQRLWKEPDAPWQDVATFTDRFHAERVRDACRACGVPR